LNFGTFKLTRKHPEELEEPEEEEEESRGFIRIYSESYSMMIL
jgi:hypothetical protein